jgi:3-hydroxybutyryl-CoA dehydrogenase
MLPEMAPIIAGKVKMDINRVDNVVIVGAGIMGVGIAQTFAQAGLTVKLVDMNQKILDDSLAQVKANLKLFNEYKLLQEKPAVILSRISGIPLESLESAIRNCQYIVEVIPEILAAKKELLARIEKVNSSGVISSNTGSFTVNELTGGMKHPERVIGVHYINPAHIIPAVEVHKGEKTSEETVEFTRALLLKSGKKPIMVRKTYPGFLINRLTGALEREIDFLLDEGVVTPEDLDIAVKGSIGFRSACLGPQETEDMIGLDTSATVSGRVFKTLSNATEPSKQLVAKVKAGELGIKSGKGWYDYSGKSREQVLEANNRKLLRQLAVYREKESEG